MIPPRGEVIGVGADLVDIARIRDIGSRHGDRFLEKVFTAGERAAMAGRADPWPGYAARFAAKEAVSKAFGTGIGEEIGFPDIGVVTDDRGAPHIVLSAKGETLLRSRNAKGIHISLTHTATLAQAYAVIVG